MGMTIRAGTADHDGLVGVEIRLWNNRFAATAFLWSDATRLSEFASGTPRFAVQRPFSARGLRRTIRADGRSFGADDRRFRHSNPASPDVWLFGG